MSTAINGTSQAQNFISRLSKLFKPEAKPGVAMGEATVPFKTAYVLTDEQEDALVTHAYKRYTDLVSELGVKTGMGIDADSDSARAGLAFASRSWMAKREIFEMVYHNRVEWRKRVLGGIFAESNLIVPLARRVVRQMAARAVDYFFATDPWFAAYPQGAQADGLAERIERFNRYKMGQAKLKQILTNAFELAFVRGETVVKTRHVTKEQIYRTFKNVLVDEAGKVVLDANQDFIFDDDAWVPEMQVVQAPGPLAAPVPLPGGATPAGADQGLQVPTAQPGSGGDNEQAEAAAGQPDNEQAEQQAGAPPQPEAVATPTGRLILKKDGKTVKPEVSMFVEKLITRKLTMSDNAEAAIVFYKDFLCPLTADSIDEADIAIHVYDMPVMDLADLYRRRNAIQSADESLDQLRNVAEVLKDLVGNGAQPKAEKNQPRIEEGEVNNTSGEDNPTAKIAECWMRYDADGDGLMEEVMLVMDISNQKAIFYDYAANLTPDGRRPFDAIRINFLDGRWHGIGAMEMFFSSQEFIDLLINRVNFNQSAAGRVTFWNPSKTIEGQNNPNLKLNNGTTYTLVPGAAATEALSHVVLPEVKGPDLFKLIEFFSQVVQLESGVIHAGDQGFSNLESAKLATGIRNIERSGQEMFGLYLGQLEDGVTPILDKMTMLTMANMNPKEVFEYFDGDATLFDEVSKEEVANISLKVKLLLTRYRSEQQLVSNQQAAAVIVQFYSLPLQIQEIVAPMYIQQLKSLQVQSADDFIKPGVAQIPPQGQAGAPSNSQQSAALAAQPQGQSKANL